MGCHKQDLHLCLGIRFLLVAIIFIPGFGLCQTSSSFEKDSLPGTGQQQTELSIQTQGRYRISVSSESGTSLQVVDAMVGALGKNGTPGQQDGQLDLLLEKGTYLVRTEGLEQASKPVRLSLEAFVEKNPTPKRLPSIDIETDQLGDLEQKSYELLLQEPGILRLEILGRHLQDARIWYRDGWVAPAIPTRTQYEPETGKPMVHLEFHHPLPAGQFLLVCYGGPGQNWSVGDPSRPLHIRRDPRLWGSEGVHELTVSPFGRESFLIEGSANYIEVHRTKPENTVLTRKELARPDAPRFQSASRSVRMTSKSKKPLLFLSTNVTRKRQWVSVQASPGDRLTLRYFPRSYGTYLDQKTKPQYLGTLHSAKIQDTVGTTALLRVTHPNQEPIFEKSQLLNITPQSNWWRQVDLQGNQVAWLRVGQAGSYSFSEQQGISASAQYQLTPYPSDKRQRRAANTFRNPGAVFDLAPGIYQLTVRPVRRGLLNFGMSATGQTPAFDPKAPPLVVPEIAWHGVKLAQSKQSRHEFLLPIQQNVAYGLIQRDWPLQLKKPLPMVLMPGESRPVKLKLDKSCRVALEKPLSFRFESNQPLPEGTILPAGNHALIVTNASDQVASGNLAAWPTPPVQPPISQRIVIKPGKNTYFDLRTNESQNFQITLAQAGMYRIETTGLLETRLTLHGRTLANLADGTRNGIGRNGLIQAYLKAGEYVLRVQTMGKTRGRLGLHLTQTALQEGGALSLGKRSKHTVPANDALRYKIPITEKGQYRVSTMGLGKDFLIRLEDSDGWPVAPVSQRGGAELTLNPGEYSYFSLPATVESRRLTQIEKVTSAKVFDGKGPHLLAWNRETHAIWREGDPDLYQFEVTATTEVRLEMTQGMVGQMTRVDDTIFGGDVWKQKLTPGSYQLKVRRPEADNQFPYQIRLSTKDLIPGISQEMDSFPASFPVRLAQPGIVDLHFEGSSDLRAELLFSAEGPSLARADDSLHDWNPRFSQRLMAGSYFLKVDAVMRTDQGSGQVHMSLRPEKRIPPKRFPFKIDQETGGQVVRMPFNLAKDRVVRFQKEKGTAISLSLADETQVLASGRESLTLPLKKGKTYEIWAWAENGSGSFTMSGISRTPKKVTLGEDASQLKKGKTLYLVADPPQTFRIDSPAQLLFSDQWEAPMLPLAAPFLNLASGDGWLEGNSARLKLTPLSLSSEKPLDLVLREASVTFHLKANKPGILQLKSVDDFWRMGLADQGSVKDPWQKMARSQDGLLLAVGEAGNFPIHLWRQDRSDVMSAVSLTFIPFESEAQSAMAGILEPGKAQRLKIPGNVRGLLLSKGMTATLWLEGSPKGIWHAKEVAAQFNLKADRGDLILFNQSALPGHFRIMPQTNPVPQSVWDTSDNVGFERLWHGEGRLNVLVPEVQGSVIHAEGSGFKIRFYGDDGSYWEGSPPASLPAKPGKFEIDHTEGWLSLWSSEPHNREMAWLGEFARESPLPEQPTTFAGPSPIHTFRIETPQFRKFQINQPGTLGLIQEGRVETLATSGGFESAVLTKYLQPGSYQLAVRPFQFAGAEVALHWSRVPIWNPREMTQGFISGGETHVYQFQLNQRAKVGLGLKAQNENLLAELIAADGQSLSKGPIIIKTLDPGTYLLAVHNAQTPTLYQPLFFGLDGSKTQIPETVIRKYLNTSR